MLSDVAAESSPIATQARGCLKLFRRLARIFADHDGPIYGFTGEHVLEQHGQLRIWGSNIGAFQPKRLTSSLDYRLRDSPRWTAAMVSILKDLGEALDDVRAIASGERENEIISPLSSVSGDSDEETEEHAGKEAEEPQSMSDIEKSFQFIPQLISRLFSLSSLVRNSSSRDRFAKALSSRSEAPVDPSFDIDHVQNKFPRLGDKKMKWLRDRLGTAITQRRQYLWYCRDHHDKMAKVSDSETAALDTQNSSNPTKKVDDPHLRACYQVLASVATKSLAPSSLGQTTATTVVPGPMESRAMLGTLDEENEDDARSMTSYASTVGEHGDENSLSVVRLEDIAKPNTPFVCPYCWMVQKFRNQRSWR